MYRRQVTAIKSGLLDCILPTYWQWLAKDAMVFVNGVGHTGNGYGEQDELDGAVIHVHVTKPGRYNLLICAARNDECARMCPQEAEYKVPEVEELPGESAFPPS